jgi:hypothetical protein
VHIGSHQPTDYSSPRGRHYQQCAFSRRRLQHPWRVHQPVLILVRGLDGKGSSPQYKKCPDYDQKTVIRVAFKTVLYIDVRSVVLNRNTDLWLCHTTEKINGKQTVVSCHLKYHTEMCFETTTGSATGSSVASGLTDE